MKLLVTGGREFADRDFVFACLDRADRKRTIMLLVHGAASGADTLADEWAVERGVARLPFPVTPAEWRALGRRAGPLRNADMLRLAAPDGVLAFPGGSGTADMVARARAAGVPVWLPVLPASSPVAAVAAA